MANAPKYDLIHLACHGLFRAENPMFSSLHLADGWITVRDICAQNLRAGLVTLSACETGRSKVSPGDELIGLGRGFLYAGAGALITSLWRVEDTINLLARAATKVVECVAGLLDRDPKRVCRDAGIPLLLASSAKKGLDVDWSDPSQKAEALNRLVQQISSLQRWIERRLPEEMKAPPLSEPINTLQQLLTQDLEPDPKGGMRIRKGVAVDRRISVGDSEMRHGRKSKSKRFNGYKRHIAADLDTDLILACAVTPANRPEDEAMPALVADIAEHPHHPTVEELHIDRGYINSELVDEVLGAGGRVICKPWIPRGANPGLFTKAAFKIDPRNYTIECPAGEVEDFLPGEVVKFDPETCRHCPLRSKCTMAAAGAGRTVAIANNELLQLELRKKIASPEGRKELRQRVRVEHQLAHIGQRQGRRARYVGIRKNLFDLRRAATLQNLETIQRSISLQREIREAA